MPTATVTVALASVLGAVLLAHVVFAQHPPAADSTSPPPRPTAGYGAGMHAHRHTPGMATGHPASPGQDAFGAIAEIVRILDADPATRPATRP